MQEYWTEHFMLPGQEHAQARAIGESLEAAREHVAGLIGCEAFEIIFTSGCTEANNLAVQGVATQHPGSHIIVSALEHDSILATVAKLQERGWSFDVVFPTKDGHIDPDQFAELIRPNTRLACLQLANSMLGTLQPVRQVADLCHSRGIAVHCDASQAFGKMAVSVAELRVDTLSLSGHKFYGPKGTGALYIRRGFPLTPVMFGEAKEMGLRPGSENVPGWIGLGAAAMLAARCCDEANATMQLQREFLCDALQQTLGVRPQLISLSGETLCNTLTFELPVEARLVQRTTRELVFATAMTGRPADEMTRCLRAIGRSDAEISRTIRLSLGWTTNREQLTRAAERIAEAIDAVKI